MAFWLLCSVHSVEAVLSALECCGVDNARIEIEGGGELPTLDGSAVVHVILNHCPYSLHTSGLYHGTAKMSCLTSQRSSKILAARAFSQ